MKKRELPKVIENRLDKELKNVKLSEAKKKKVTEEVQKESEDLFAFLPGSNIEADEANSARSIRGLSNETEQYAQNRQTPAAYQEALDRVLAMSVSQGEVEEFLKSGKIGEYSE